MRLLKAVLHVWLAVTLPSSLVAQARFTFSNYRLSSGNDAPVSIIDPATGQCIRPTGEPWHLQLMAAPATAPSDTMQPLTPLLNFAGPGRPGYVWDEPFDVPNGVIDQWENIWVRVLNSSDPATAAVVAIAGPFGILPEAHYDYSFPGLPPGSLDFCGHGLFVSVASQPYPDTLTVNEGDTVIWEVVSPLTTVIESYTGEWTSPGLKTGETFSYTFSKVGTYVYRTSSGDPALHYPGVIRVRRLSGARPAVSIVGPMDNSIVDGYAGIQAVVTNAPSRVNAVNFYADDQLIGTARTPPYFVTADFSQRLGTYQIHASVVDTSGQTNSSSPITVTFDGERLFHPWRLPQGEMVFFISGAGCYDWSDDLKTWNPRLPGQRVSGSVFVDETTTNTLRRYYRMVPCP